MCQDCYDDLDEYDQDEPDPPEETGPDPWNWHPSLRERITWRISAWRRRLDMKLHPDRYYTEPPF